LILPILEVARMSTALVAKLAGLPVVTNDLDVYIQQVNVIPVLTAEEEQTLANNLQQSNDLTAAQQLILSHLRYVVQIARGYMGYGLPLGDLVQEGNIGLMKAVKRFDPDRGVRLASFAIHWIKAEIQEYVLRNWRIVKVATTKAQRKLFFNLRSSKKRLGWINRREAETVAKDLNVDLDLVMEMDSRMSGQDVSFDPTPDAGDDDDNSSVYSPAQYLTDQGVDPLTQLEGDDWEEQTYSQFTDALDDLDERSKEILQRRWLAEKKATLHELAEEYGVSAERIRQIENKAIKQLRASLATA
jgi:RNA polymerase sigma-32 factor